MYKLHCLLCWVRKLSSLSHFWCFCQWSQFTMSPILSNTDIRNSGTQCFMSKCPHILLTILLIYLREIFSSCSFLSFLAITQNDFKLVYIYHDYSWSYPKNLEACWISHKDHQISTKQLLLLTWCFMPYI